jgi:MFS family permease
LFNRDRCGAGRLIESRSTTKLPSLQHIDLKRKFGEPSVAGAFRSLSNFNYRLWVCGALVSNIGTWIQRIAQDWLVFTHLSDHNATAVGIVMALQAGPTLVLLPLTGYAADHIDRRRLLMATQAGLAVLALILGLLTVSGVINLIGLYALALAFGCVTAFDGPARQVFVSQLVRENELANAVALNATSFNAARLIGPSIAGILIGTVGSGPAILINAATFLAVLLSLALMRRKDLHAQVRPAPSGRGLSEGFRYVWAHPELRIVMAMIFLIGTFGLNFPIFVSTMTVSVLHAGATQYGMLTSAIAVGAVAGSILSARHTRLSIANLRISTAVFGIGLTVAAIAPNFWVLAAALAIVGAAGVSFTTSTSSFMQLATDPAVRGRVMSIRLALGLGTTSLGAPIVGWVADFLGPRWALGAGASSCALAFMIAFSFERKIRSDGLPQTDNSH